MLDIGSTYGRLTVTKKITDGRSECLCSCGKTLTLMNSYLTMNKTKSCGCGRNKYLKYRSMDCLPKNKRFKNYIGIKFNKLTAVKFVGLQNDSNSSVWEFECECGKRIIRIGSQVRSGDIKSCGCMKSEMISKNFLLPDGLSIKNGAYHVHIKCAEKRNFKSHLTFDQYIEIASKPCRYCGGMSKRMDTKKKRSILLNSVDRLNNELYYKIENSVPCCFICQKAKGAMPEKDFLSMVQSIVKFRGLNDQI